MALEGNEVAGEVEDEEAAAEDEAEELLTEACDGAGGKGAEGATALDVVEEEAGATLLEDACCDAVPCGVASLDHGADSRECCC